MPNLVVFSGNAHPQLAHKVVSHLHIPLGAASVNRFSDGEISVEINENVRGKDVFEHTSLRWRLVSGEALALVKDFPPDIEQLESRLRRGGVQFHADTVRDPETNKLREMRYRFTADFEGAINIAADHDAARLRFELVNLDGFETVTVEFPAFEVGNGRMDDLARWLMGEPNGFLKGGQSLRRIEA